MTKYLRLSLGDPSWFRPSYHLSAEKSKNAGADASTLAVWYECQPLMSVQNITRRTYSARFLNVWSKQMESNSRTKGSGEQSDQVRWALAPLFGGQDV